MSLTAVFLLALPVSQSAIGDIARAEQARLNACIERVETEPTEAYEDSLAWLSSGNRPKARYCNAIALLALDQLEEGAARLEALATAPDAISLNDRALYMTQAGNAWLTAGYPDAAIKSLSEAIKIDANNPDTLKDRSAAYIMLERWFEAVDDLNAALELVPTDPEALSMRARVHLNTKNLPAANADMAEARIYDPTNIDILVLRGEIREAMRLEREGR